jgi:hypothetical protein
MRYDFTHKPKKNVLHAEGVVDEPQPVSPPVSAISTRSTTPKRKRMYNQTNVNNPEEISVQLIPALHHVDNGIKRYFSNLQVPTDDSVRTDQVPVRIAGGDKTTLYWKQAIRGELRNGRIKLPVMSINRESFEFNPLKFSPAYMPVARRFANSDGSRMALTYRPYPVLLNYTLSMWAERKRDIDYMLFQIAPRFNGGLAEFSVDAGIVTGTIVMKMNNYTDNSDIEKEASDLALVQYDMSITAEAWIPLPEKIVPTVLGAAVTLVEDPTGEFLEVGRVGPASISIGESDARPT